MNISKNILLPGLDKQLEFLKKHLAGKVESVLIIGSASEIIAGLIANSFSCSVELIVEEYESFINSRIILGKDAGVKVSTMDFELTDFGDESFDLIYAQASISTIKRNKIVKEIKRLLKPSGLLCVGEIVSLKKEIPGFIRDLFKSSNLLPLYIDEIEKYYAEKNFKIIANQNLSNTLSDYYRHSAALLKDRKENLTDKEKSYYKKILNKISHESNVYLKLGGDKFLGFISLLVQKGVN